MKEEVEEESKRRGKKKRGLKTTGRMPVPPRGARSGRHKGRPYSDLRTIITERRGGGVGEDLSRRWWDSNYQPQSYFDSRHILPTIETGIPLCFE